MADLNLPVDEQLDWGEPLRVAIQAVNTDAETVTDMLLLHLTVDPTPHPQYDDIPDLTLRFENGLI